MRRPSPDVPPNTRVLGFIRPDHSKRITVILFGAIPMVVGALLVGYGFGRLEAVDPAGLHHDAREYVSRREPAVATPSPEQSEETGALWLFFAGGLALVASGPMLAFFILGGVWRREEWVLLRDDAMVLQCTDGDTTLPWNEMDRIFYDPDLDLVALTFLEGEPMALPRRFDCGAPKDTAERLDAMRRKASFGLL